MYERTSEHRRLEAAKHPGQRPGAHAGRSFLEWASAQRPENGETAEPPGEPSVRQLASILLRRKWMIAAVTLTGTLLLTAAAMMIPPAYTAMTQIKVVPAGDSQAGADPTASPAGIQMVVDTHMVMLRTHDFLKKVVTPLPWFQNGSNDRVIDDLGKQISINQLMSSSIIAIRVTLPDPREAANLANRIADVYLDQQVEGQVAQLRDELARVDKRVSRVRDAMTSAQARMRQQARLETPVNADSTTDRSSWRRDFANLEEEVSRNAQFLVELTRRQRELRQRIEAVSPDLRIVSRANPPVNASSLPPILFIVPGAVFLLIGSCFTAIARDRLDQSLRSPQDVTSALSIPCLGLVPQSRRLSLVPAHDYLQKDPFSAYAESIRSIAAAMGFAQSSGAPKVILLTCSEPGEGKTTLAISLAHYAATIGRRTLLIDLDLRTPNVLNELGVAARHNLVDLVTRRVDRTDVVLSDAGLGFDVLPMTSAPVDPLQIAADPSLGVILDDFRAHYDVMLIDGPPALGRAETGLVAAMADCILFVVKWGATRRDVARNAVRSLLETSGGTQVVGAVINQVAMRSHARYRFGDAAEVVIKHGTRLLPRHRPGRVRAAITALARAMSSAVSIPASRISDWCRRLRRGLAG